MDPEVIILYGNVSAARSSKVQRLVDGEMTCGYRDYAQRFGAIVYLSPVQRAEQPWELVCPDGRGVVELCHKYPDSIVWAVKPGNDARTARLAKIRNRKLYYSCCARSLINPCCDINLVDTEERRHGHDNAVVWFKGKDPGAWSPLGDDTAKIYDYVVVGRPKAGKNQRSFVKQLARECGNARNVLWIGGGDERKQIGSHQLVSTPMQPPRRVCEWMRLARVGVVFSEYGDEGFPQTLLELTMCGVPVVYSDSGPFNPIYFSEKSAVRTGREKLIDTAEELLRTADAAACRDYAASTYSLQASFDNLKRIAATINK